MTNYFKINFMKHFLIFLLLSISIYGYGQARVLKGTVTSESGELMPGVNVLVEGTTIGVVTNTDGTYSLNIPVQKNILIFSFIGYLTDRIDVTGKDIADVRLVSDVKSLEEIVVVGYGNQKKVNLTGSIESLKGDVIAKRSTIMTSQALQGMAPGVTVTSNSGKPGKEGTSIRVRGIGTLNDNNPLVLVDGVASSVDAVDPNDIENISILKDAASASIYGSRAANGVILITTKRGKTEKTSVMYKGSYGFSLPLEIPKNATAWDYMTMYDEANGNDLRNDAGVPGGAIYGATKIEEWKNATDRDAYPNSDMFRETYRDRATQTQHYLGFSIGNEKFRSNTSINYTWQDAHIPNSLYKRYGVRSNNSYTLNKIFEFGFDLSVRNTDIDDAASGTLIEGLMRQPAIYQTRYSNDVWGTSYAGTPHAMQYIYEGLNMR